VSDSNQVALLNEISDANKTASRVGELLVDISLFKFTSDGIAAQGNYSFSWDCFHKILNPVFNT
jgi:hypothetical protein